MGIDQLVTGGDVDDPIVDSLKAEEATITDETLIDTYASSNQTISADTWETVGFDTKEIDVLDEFNLSNNQFSPSTDGYYQVLCSVTLNDGASGDQVGLRLQNVTDDVSETVFFATHTGFLVTASSNITRKLSANKTYEVQVRNYDSSDTIETGLRPGDVTFLTVRSAYL